MVGEGPTLRETGEGAALLVLVQPRASRPGVSGVSGGRVRVRVAAPPVEGAANAEVTAVLAKAVGVPRSSVVIAAGGAGRRKTVLFRGLGAALVREALRALGAETEGGG